ncbi:hypothetical protein EFU33_18265 [Vibrio cholerae]|nr:hypothetical protein [Vibrio cholerae]
MSTDTSFTIDVNKLIHDIFGGNPHRNDLAIGLYNDTDASIKVDYYLEHGSIVDISKGNTVHSQSLWEIGAHAKGAGSNITLNVTMPNGSGWAIMAATPSNKENYFKVHHNKNGYKDARVAHKAADKDGKHYSTKGIYDEDHNGYNAVISITGESPAACCIVFEKLD